MWICGWWDFLPFDKVMLNLRTTEFPEMNPNFTVVVSKQEHLMFWVKSWSFQNKSWRIKDGTGLVGSALLNHDLLKTRTCVSSLQRCSDAQRVVLHSSHFVWGSNPRFHRLLGKASGATLLSSMSWLILEVLVVPWPSNRRSEVWNGVGKGFRSTLQRCLSETMAFGLAEVQTQPGITARDNEQNQTRVCGPMWQPPHGFPGRQAWLQREAFGTDWANVGDVDTWWRFIFCRHLLKFLKSSGFENLMKMKDADVLRCPVWTAEEDLWLTEPSVDYPHPPSFIR